MLRRYGADYLRRYPLPPGSRIERTLRELAACRTPALGGHVAQCEACRQVAYRYHSCGNRHCPQCGGNKRAAWFKRQEAQLLPVPYFHVVFTLPHELSALVLGNRAKLYGLLFEAAAATLLTIAADPKHLGADIGLLMVLHTWGQQLEHHPHVHVIVPGGGLSPDGQRWVSCGRDWLLSQKVLQKLFRGKYLAGVKELHERGELGLAGSTAELADKRQFNAFLRPLYKMKWAIYLKAPFGGPAQVLKYLARYTHRVAISNQRLVKLDDRGVTFTWKDYADGCRHKEMTLTAVEFVRRLALHILPRSFVRIRYYGLLAHRGRHERLAKCRELLGASAATQVPATSLCENETAMEHGNSECLCPKCGEGLMATRWRMDRPTGPQLERHWQWDSS